MINKENKKKYISIKEYNSDINKNTGMNIEIFKEYKKNGKEPYILQIS